jgi:LPS export ABC transporter protein LptC
MPGCSREPAVPERKEKGPVPQQIMQGVRLRQTSVRGLLWVLEADSGISYGPDEPTHLKTLTVRFYDASPEVRSVLTSKRGTVNDQSRTLEAEDSVVVVTPAGERLETESLRWDPAREQIQTDDFFRLTRGGDVLTGYGIEADPDLRRYVVRRQVRAEMKDEGDQQLREALDGDSSARR